MTSAIKIIRPWLTLLKTAITGLPHFAWWKVLFYSRNCVLDFFWIKKKSQNELYLNQRFLQKCFSKVVTFILAEDKEKNIQQHQFPEIVMPESLRKQFKFLWRISIANIFRNTLQIVTKLCNHNHTFNTDLKPEVDAPFHIVVKK